MMVLFKKNCLVDNGRDSLQGSTALTDPRGLDHPPRADRRPARGGPDRLEDFESLEDFPPTGSPHEFLVSTGSCEGKQTKNHWLAGATLTMYER